MCSGQLACSRNRLDKNMCLEIINLQLLNGCYGSLHALIGHCFLQ